MPPVPVPAVELFWSIYLTPLLWSCWQITTYSQETFSLWGDAEGKTAEMRQKSQWEARFALFESIFGGLMRHRCWITERETVAEKRRSLPVKRHRSTARLVRESFSYPPPHALAAFFLSARENHAHTSARLPPFSPSASRTENREACARIYY